jgi:hypothetical protein
MVEKLSALCASRPLPAGRFLVLIFVRRYAADPRTIVRLEGLSQLKNPMISSGMTSGLQHSASTNLATA